MGSEISNEYTIRGDFLASQSLLGHPGLYGWFMSFSFSLSIGYALYKRSMLSKFLMLFFFVAIVVSLRKKAIFASFIIIFIAIFLALPSVKKKIFYTLILLLGAITLYFLIDELFISLVKSIRMDALGVRSLWSDSK